MTFYRPQSMVKICWCYLAGFIPALLQRESPWVEQLGTTIPNEGLPDPLEDGAHSCWQSRRWVADLQKQSSSGANQTVCLMSTTSHQPLCKLPGTPVL